MDPRAGQPKDSPARQSSEPRVFQRRVQILFERALDIAPEEREDWLARACGDDAGLKAELDGLFEVTDVSARFLDGAQAAESFQALESVAAGERVGPYEVERELGRGGMGVVLLARRADGQFEQRVALKLLRRGMNSEAILTSFLRERQILAWLAHPNVARLYDGGITEDGRPWFALEYVEGRRITDYCEAERLDSPERIELVIQACKAIGHAHRNLIIHRDLKPSNVLVTDAGELKLLDFGIAEVLGEIEPSASFQPLGFGAMTPDYAAPEQLREQPVTTAVDIHALGVLLQELLSGKRPHAPSAPPDAEQEPRVLASRLASDPRTRRFLRGDLDRILLKATHPEPEMRYDTAGAFAEDLRRFLDGLPVRAHPATLPYRTSRFVRRHRWALLGTALAVVVLGGAALFASVESARARRERARTASVKDFLVNLVQSANPHTKGGAAVRDEAILAVALERAETELDAEPEMQAELYDVVGKAYVARGDLDHAAEPLTQSLALQRKIHGHLDGAVADAAYGMAALRRRQKRYDEAEGYYREALDIRRTLDGEMSLEVSVLLNGLGANAYGAGDLERSEHYYRRSLAIKEALLEPDDPEIATGRHNLALLMRRQGRLEPAEAMMRQALAVYRQAYGDEHPVVAMSLGGLGRILHALKRYDEAAAELQLAHEIRLRAYGTDHPLTRRALRNLAMDRFDQGELGAAEAALRSLLGTIEQDLGSGSAEYVDTLCDLAEVFFAQERLDDVQSTLARADTLGAALDGGSKVRTRVLGETGALALARGQLEGASSRLRRAAAVAESEGWEGTLDGLRIRVRLGTCLSRLGRFAEADSLLGGAYTELQRSFAYTRDLRSARDRLAEHRERAGRGEAAHGPE